MAYNNNMIKNTEVVKELLHTDLQKRLYNQYTELGKGDYRKCPTDEDYDRACSNLYVHIHGIKTLKGVNDVLCHYSDLFTEYDELLVPTIEGTNNYIIDLLVKQCNNFKSDDQAMEDMLEQLNK